MQITRTYITLHNVHYWDLHYIAQCALLGLTLHCLLLESAQLLVDRLFDVCANVSKSVRFGERKLRYATGQHLSFIDIKEILARKTSDVRILFTKQFTH